MQWFLYFLYYLQVAQPVPSTKVQASSMTPSTILMTYQLTGGLHSDPWDVSLECDNNNYYWYAIDTTDGNVKCVFDTYS